MAVPLRPAQVFVGLPLTKESDILTIPRRGFSRFSHDDLERAMGEDAHQKRRPLRVLLVDDSAIVREKLSWFLVNVCGFEVVGSAEDGLEAVKAFERLMPDVLILDLQLPRLSGMDVLKALQQRAHQCRILVFSGFTDDLCRERCRQLGAHHVFEKAAEFERFIETLKSLP